MQTRENHTRFDPLFHFVLAPASLVLLVWSLVHFSRHRSVEAGLISAGLLVLFLTIFKMRLYSLKVQDRVIRLEERLRLAQLCGAANAPFISDLTEGQLIALRFASDAELPALARRAAEEKLASKQIKAEIKQWRGDYFRV